MLFADYALVAGAGAEVEGAPHAFKLAASTAA